MVCRNCGREFDGKFCPDCGTFVEEQTTDIVLDSEDLNEEAEILVCPDCGQERLGDGKFCVNCGYNYESQTQPESDEKSSRDNYSLYKHKKEIKFNFNSAMGIISKIYRYLLAGGMLFVGLISLLCLTSPTVTEELLGIKADWSSGYAAIGGTDVPPAIINSSRMLLIISFCALIYGGWLLYLAIKKPYSTVKKYQYWAADGVISLILIILGGVVSSTASKEGMNGKAGSGFAMCIVMGVFGFIFLALRIYYELKVFKWSDTGLSEEQMAKSLEKKPKKQRVRKERNTESQTHFAQTPSVITPEIESSKKRKHLILTLDLIIALIPIIFVILMLIIMSVPQRYDGEEMPLLIQYLIFGGASMGFVFFLCILVRCFSEVLVYKWVDPYPNKKLSLKQKVLIPLLLATVLSAIIVPTVMVSGNIFRVGKVDMIYIGDNKAFVTDVLGEPYEMSEYVYEYYSDNYIKLVDQIKKEFGEYSVNVDTSQNDKLENLAINDDNQLNKLEELLEKMEKLTYKYIRVEFDSKEEVSSILLDTNRCDSKENKKTVKDYDVLGGTTVQLYEQLKLTCSIYYTDGGFYKVGINQVCSDINQGSVKWKDVYGNEFSYKINVKANTNLTYEDIDNYIEGKYNSSDRTLLTEFTVSPYVTSIERGAFEGCAKLKSIVIPSSVTIIEYEAFSDCDSLVIYCESKIKPSGWSSNWNNEGRPVVWNYKSRGFTDGFSWALTNSNTITIVGYSGKSTNLTIPETINGYDVNCIAAKAFYDNSNLRSIYIPDCITSVGEYAFTYNYYLNIYCEAQSKPSGWDTYWKYNVGDVHWGYNK